MKDQHKHYRLRTVSKNGEGVCAVGGDGGGGA